MSMARLLEVCRNGTSSYSLGYLQFDYHRGRIFFPLPPCMLKGVVVLVPCSVIRLVGYDPVICLSTLKRSQVVD